MHIGVTIIAVISITLTTLVFLSKKSQVKDSFVYPFIANLLCVTCLHSVSFAMYWFSSDDVNVEGFLCDVQSFLMVLTCQSQEIWHLHHSNLLSSCGEYETIQFLAESFFISDIYRVRVFSTFYYPNHSI